VPLPEFFLACPSSSRFPFSPLAPGAFLYRGLHAVRWSPARPASRFSLRGIFFAPRAWRLSALARLHSRRAGTPPRATGQARTRVRTLAVPLARSRRSFGASVSAHRSGRPVPARCGVSVAVARGADGPPTLPATTRPPPTQKAGDGAQGTVGDSVASLSPVPLSLGLPLPKWAGYKGREQGVWRGDERATGFAGARVRARGAGAPVGWVERRGAPRSQMPGTSEG